MKVTRKTEANGRAVMFFIEEVTPEEVIIIQSRAEMRFDKVDEYAEMMRDGTVFDPCLGCLDNINQKLYVWDGCHRVEAAKKAGKLLTIDAWYGGKDDAEWLAFTANAKHGMQRTPKDVERIVKGALQHPLSADRSDRDLARHCGVSHPTIAKYRKELIAASGKTFQIDSRQVTRNGVTYQQKASRKGEQRGKYEALYDKPRCLFCGETQEYVFQTPAKQKTGICVGCAKLALQDLGEHYGLSQ